MKKLLLIAAICIGIPALVFVGLVLANGAVPNQWFRDEFHQVTP